MFSVFGLCFLLYYLKLSSGSGFKVKRYPALLEDNSQCQHTECSSGVISFVFKWLNPPLYASQPISFQQFCHANNNVR